MRRECPNSACVHHDKPPRGWCRKHGTRKTTRGLVKRYQCVACETTWSAKPATTRQKRPELNRIISTLVVSGMPLRRIALVAGCSRTTVSRKIEMLAERAWRVHVDRCPDTSHAMMDELETFVGARWRQVSVVAVIRTKTGEILSVDAAVKPSNMKKGQAQGWTVDGRPKMLQRVLESVVPHIHPGGVLTTDGKTDYPALVALYAPGVIHHPVNSPKGQPGAYNPLFAIDHLFAKMRQDLPRLFRSTWSQSKDLIWLRRVLWLYVAWNNGYELGRG
jgi:hypothetical protein